MTFDSLEASRIEFLGLNCELGFAMKALGHNEPALLRWCFTPPYSLTPLIDADFVDIYQPENLIACGPKLVRDTRYDIAYHTNVRTEQLDGTWVFVDDDVARRERIFNAERNLVLSYVTKFRRRFQTSDTIYVLSRHDSSGERLALDIIESLKARSGDCSFSFLEVYSRPAGAERAFIERINGQYFRGYVDFFAPIDRADEIDIDSWTHLLGQALKVTVQHTSNEATH